MIEKTVRDLNYANYALVKQGSNILVTEKDKTKWNIIRDDKGYTLSSVEKGLKKVAFLESKKKVKLEKLLKWTLSSLNISTNENIKSSIKFKRRRY
ncbi:MAG: hypothetical protein HUJ68_03540 [Clostridia bacterium]|nr:hypothetical protein [Clostridia bacterium]